MPFLIPPVVLIATQLWISATLASYSMAPDPRMIYTLGALLAVMGGALSADSFAGERERNTLELLLSLPISPRAIFWAKVLAILPLPLFFACLAQVLFWLLFPGKDGVQLLCALSYSLAASLVVTGLSVLVSLRAPSVRAAGQTNALFVLGVLLATQGLAPVLAQSPALSAGLLLLAGLAFTGFTHRALQRFARL